MAKLHRPFPWLINARLARWIEVGTVVMALLWSTDGYPREENAPIGHAPGSAARGRVGLVRRAPANATASANLIDPFKAYPAWESGMLVVPRGLRLHGAPKAGPLSSFRESQRGLFRGSAGDTAPAWKRTYGASGYSWIP